MIRTLSAVAVLSAAASLQAATILVDFEFHIAPLTPVTPADDVRTWNSAFPNNPNPASVPLNWDSGTASGATLIIPRVAPAFDANAAGAPTPTGDAAARGYPGNATIDNFFSGGTDTSVLTITGLDDSTAYTFYFFGSRMNSPTTNRTCRYTVDGAGVATFAELNVADNTGNIVSVPNVYPDSGTITVGVAQGTGNASGYYYLGVMEIVTVPEPAGLGLLGLAGCAALRRRRHV